MRKFGNWNVGAWVLGYCDVGNGKKIIFSEFGWLYSLLNTSFLCVCFVAEKIRENCGDWYVGG